MPPEKDILVRIWEKLDDDVIIKEVATKGKHVNHCIAFLAQRNELSHNEATNYFLQKVSAGKSKWKKPKLGWVYLSRAVSGCLFRDLVSNASL